MEILNTIPEALKEELIQEVQQLIKEKEAKEKAETEKKEKTINDIVSQFNF